MNVVEHIVDRLSVFNNLYDIVRIVDPVNKNTNSAGEGSSCCTDDICYGFWNKEFSCKNCVSMRAYVENDTCIKLEYKDDKVYIVIASPVKIDDKVYIAELLKDITTGNSIIKNGVQVQNIEKFVQEMNNKAVTDELSGAYNRKYLIERLPIELQESMKNNDTISAIALDIDLFSNVNQIYGYKSGDKILKEIAEILLKHTVSEKDWIARYGGDKFIIVLNKCNLQEGYFLAEKIRKVIENTSFVCEPDLVNITVSLSVCELTNLKLDAHKLLSLIKDSMHEAKSQGRNTTIIKTY